VQNLFEVVEALDCARLMLWSDRQSGLRAVLAIDDVSLGPAAGGIRTWKYGSLTAAVHDAAGLARSMTIKTALAGLDAGGGKIVVIDHPGLDRPAAFARLGQLIEELGGLMQTAGDLGTTAEDLAAAARHTSYVQTSHADLTAATARTLVRCAESCGDVAGRGGLRGMRVAVQGCGAIGDAVARALAAAGAHLLVSDMVAARAQRTAGATGARIVAPESVLLEDVDMVCPCAVGGVLTTALADRIKAWAVCGAANNVLAEPAAERRLGERGILFVPDVLASSGAVIKGVTSVIMRLPDSAPLIDAIGETARSILTESRESRRPASEIAHERARARIAAARAAATPPAGRPGAAPR
jgi:leucine dehydrogenase